MEQRRRNPRLEELVRLFVERIDNAASLHNGFDGGIVRLVDARGVEDLEAAGA